MLLPDAFPVTFVLPNLILPHLISSLGATFLLSSLCCSIFTPRPSPLTFPPLFPSNFLFPLAGLRQTYICFSCFSFLPFFPSFISSFVTIISFQFPFLGITFLSLPCFFFLFLRVFVFPLYPLLFSYVSPAWYQIPFQSSSFLADPLLPSPNPLPSSLIPFPSPEIQPQHSPSVSPVSLSSFSMLSLFLFIFFFSS